MSIFKSLHCTLLDSYCEISMLFIMLISRYAI